MTDESQLGLVVIGRNEGMRLVRCLASVASIPRRVYVDSGSTDDSIGAARRAGVEVVELRIPPAFSAARARNAGLARLLELDPQLEFVQMVDGDCEVQPGWIEKALGVLRADEKLALVFGRLRERHPDRSIYNALCDDEWNVPPGEAAGVGGIALFRVAALREVDFYNPAMIAGEDTELAMRLRKRGWRLWRADAEMALHDAAMTRFSQWWKRTRRSGHGFGEMAFLHPDARNPNWPRTVRSIVAWGGIMPAALLAAVLLALAVSPLWWPVAAALLLIWPVRMAQLALRQRRRGLPVRVATASGVLLMLGKVPQLLGLARFHLDRLRGRASQLVEYKTSE